MSAQAFCTSCGAPRISDAKFCTSCGAPAFGAASSQHGATTVATTSTPPVAALAVAALLFLVGGAATFYSMQKSTDVPRAVSGAPSGGGTSGGMGGGEPAGELPSGHPSIDLPKEVVAFLDGLTAEAEKNPQSIDAAQKLVRARYRASVINGSFRASTEQALAKLLALDPSNIEGLRVSANLAYDSEDFPEAERRFQAFLEKNPDDSSALTDLGSAQLFQDRTDEAIKSYQAAIAKDPKFMQAHFNMGVALQKAGKKDDAVASLKRAMELADSPDEKQHVENALAEMEGREPQHIAGAREERPSGGMGGASAGGGAPGGMGGGMPGGAPAMGGGMPMPPPAPERDVPTNASTDFQRDAQKTLITHPIVGPRIVSFEWTGPTAGRVKIADFPMDKMPPFARAKFKSGMADKLAAVAKKTGVSGAVTVEIVDNASGTVMETLDTSGAAQ